MVTQFKLNIKIESEVTTMAQNKNLIQLGSDVSVYERLALQKFRQQDYMRATRYYEKVLELSPENFDAKQNLATCYTKRNMPERAEAIFYEEISQGENLEAAYYELSQLNMDLNEPNKAYLFGLNYALTAQDDDYRDELEKMFEVTIHAEHQLETESQLFVVQIIFQYLFGQGRLLDARKYILKQDESIQDNRIVRNLLAMCYLYLNENQIAKEMFERLLQEDSSDVHALCHYTLLLYNMNEVASFKHYLKVLNKVVPINDDESFKLGIVLSYLKQYASSQKLLMPLYKKGKFQTFQLFHALAFNYYYLGNRAQSQYFWERLVQVSKVHPGPTPWDIEESFQYFNAQIKPLLTSDDQHQRLYGLFLLKQLNGNEVLMTKEVWSILEELGDYEKLYLSYLIQNLQLTKLHFIHLGMLELYQHDTTKQESALFLSWINYAESLLAKHVDTDKVVAYVAAVTYLYFKSTDPTYSQLDVSEVFDITVKQLEMALDELLSI